MKKKSTIFVVVAGHNNLLMCKEEPFSISGREKLMPECWSKTIYSRTSVARTLIARSPRLFRTRF